jgi:hypothetical protein
MTCGVRFGKCEDLLKLDGVRCPACPPGRSIDGRRVIYCKIEGISYDAWAMITSTRAIDPRSASLLVRTFLPDPVHAAQYRGGRLLPYQSQAFHTRRIIDGEQDGDRGGTDVPGMAW